MHFTDEEIKAQTSLLATALVLLKKKKRHKERPGFEPEFL